MNKHRLSAVFMLVLALAAGAEAVAASVANSGARNVLGSLPQPVAPGRLAELCPAGDLVHRVHSDGITMSFTPREALKLYQTEIHPQLLRFPFALTYSDGSTLRYGLTLGGRGQAEVDLVRQPDGGWYPVDASACNSLLTSREER
jgi:hypothetical protein